jgi:hypothetical protein
MYAGLSAFSFLYLAAASRSILPFDRVKEMTLAFILAPLFSLLIMPFFVIPFFVLGIFTSSYFSLSNVLKHLLKFIIIYGIFISVPFWLPEFKKLKMEYKGPTD